MRGITTTDEENLPIGQKYDCIVINTHFEISNISNTDRVDPECNYLRKSRDLIFRASQLLKEGGLLFVYGLPKFLPSLSTYLNDLKLGDNRFLFKYWIALEFKPVENIQILPNSHLGCLMYLKTKSLKSPTPFNFNTKEIREPYTDCPSCGKNTKDWGGKKHLMNPLGAALSDVWKDIRPSMSETQILPEEFLERIYDLINEGESELLFVKQKELELPQSRSKKLVAITHENIPKVNQVVEEECMNYMRNLKSEYPEGVFDLAFADPPYNLAKNYDEYSDEKSDKQYINWCNKWLKGMYDVLKPGGALLVLNIPKWAVFHAEFLLNKMEFRHWIVWNALSVPGGKLMPAHYALIYFTKPGGKPTNNFEEHKLIPNRKYCLRNSCRKGRNKEEKELLTEIWHDVHRIKHKKDRDQHPCQLPIELMNRIIELFTNEGDMVFDPFGGAGTTAVSAKLLNRNFILTEIDKKYVNISKKNLSKVKKKANGEKFFERISVKKASLNKIPNKVVETRYLRLCASQNRSLSREEIKELDPELDQMLDDYNGKFRKLKNFSKRKLEALELVK